MAKVTRMWAIIGDGESEGIWAFKGFPLVITDVELGTPVERRLEQLQAAANMLAQQSGGTYKLLEFALVNKKGA